MRTRTRKPKTSRAHGTGSTGSYYPATRITLQPYEQCCIYNVGNTDVPYSEIFPESCDIMEESLYSRYAEIEHGRDSMAKEILHMPEVHDLAIDTPNLALVVQYGHVYGEEGFIPNPGCVSFDPLSASRIKELLDEDWEDC